MRHAFEAQLDAFEHAQEPRAFEPPPPRNFETIVSALPPELKPETGSHSLWDFAAAWTPEADPPPEPEPAPPPPRPSAKPEDIANELNFLSLRSLDDIARARRRFMWDNHPDRRKDLDRELANRRVALANSLLDQMALTLTRRGALSRGRVPG